MTNKRWYSHGNTCTSCGVPVSNNSKSGSCRACFMVRLLTDPDRGAKVSASLKRRLEDPTNYAALCEQNRRAGLAKRMDPEFRAKAARVMRERIQPISVATGANMRGRDWEEMTRLGLEARWAWCPPEYRDEYRAMRTAGFKMAEARRMIRVQIDKDKADARKAQEAMSPFERQMQALERGAQIIANDRHVQLEPTFSDPTLRRAG